MYVVPHRFTAWVLLGGIITPTPAMMVADMAAGILGSPSISQEETLGGQNTGVKEGLPWGNGLGVANLDQRNFAHRAG